MDIAPKSVGSLHVSEDDLFTNNLDFFSTPKRETALSGSYVVAYKPTHLDNGGPYQFNIASQGSSFIDLPSTRVYLKVKVTETDDTIVGDAQAVAPVNNFGCAFFEQTTIDFDGSAAPELSNSDMDYKSYFETVLSYDFMSETSGHLEAQGFKMDDAAKFNTFTLDAAANSDDGFTRRAKWIQTSHSFLTVSPLLSDFFQIERYFPPGRKLTVTLHRAKDDHLLLSTSRTTLENGTQKTDSFKIIVQDIKLFVKHVTLTDEVTTKMLNKMLNTPLRYSFTKNIMKRFTIPQATQSEVIPYFLQGSFPRSVIVSFHQLAATNNLASNPFFLNHFNLSYAVLRINGVSVPSVPYEPDWTTPTGFMREYRSLYDNIGIKHSNASCMVAPGYFKTGLFFLAFDLTPDGCNGFHKHLHSTGVMELEVRFKTPLANPIACIAMFSFDAELTFTPDNKFSVTY